MKILLKVLFSMLTTGVLLVVFAVVIAFATFIENDFGTAAAKILVYNAWWFELLLFLLAINLAGSIWVNKLLTAGRWPIAMFHISFIIILAGAGLTRYRGFEGTMHIREGQHTNQLVSRNSFVRITAHDENGNADMVTKEVRFISGMKNRFHSSLEIGDKKINIDNIMFVPSAVMTPVDDTDGEPVISFLAVDATDQPVEFFLKEGESRLIGNVLFKFGGEQDTTSLRFFRDEEMLFVEFPDTLKMIFMESDESELFAPGKAYPMIDRSIFQAGDVGFVLKRFYPGARFELVQAQAAGGMKYKDALKLRITAGEDVEELIVFGHPGSPGDPARVSIGGITVEATYGALIHNLPFHLLLKEFQLERYPGSNSPSSFASEVVLMDPANNIEKPYRIFMNNILKYGGYRFFQSSYDEDEKGTILSVNYDSAGTTVTYIGYFFMSLGMILGLFFRKSRFRKLAISLASLKSNSIKGTAMLLLLMIFGSTLTVSAQETNGSLSVVSPEHAKFFGRVQVQNFDGRIEPANTLASELLRKISRKNSHNGMSPVQVMLSMMMEPEKWENEPIVKVSGSDMKRIIGVSGSFAAFNDFLDPAAPNGYKLSRYIEEAYDKSPGERNKFDKEVITVDERVNILYKMLSGGFLAIFPVPGDKDNKWLSLPSAHTQSDRNLAVFATTAIQEYLAGLQEGLTTGNYSNATAALESIKANQKSHGAEIYPSGFKTTLEIFYINFNIFSKLARVYIIVGFIMLIIRFILLFSPTRSLSRLSLAAFWVVLFLFVVHTTGLAIRWYISGHAPWSNGYETLLYISWSACLAGLIFSKRSPMTLAVTTILAAISLFVAGMSWMSPELTNLVPVLKSYWLIIHVAVITSSYGFLGMGALLGLVNLIMIILRNPSNAIRINITIRELSLIIEMALIVGLYLLTIGSFLGGVWANESWGRYWGWDPKETWALVTILVYAFITHMHKIHGLRGDFALSTAALLGFSSVLMTFFGVNYYLSGLHSYAQGDPPPVPSGVYIAVVVVLLLVITAGIVQRVNSQGKRLK